MAPLDVEKLRTTLQSFGAIDDRPNDDAFGRPPGLELPLNVERIELSSLAPDIPLMVDATRIAGDLRVLDHEVATTGIEALAWYLSYHYAPPGRWGIFIRESGVLYLAQQVLGGRAATLAARCTVAFQYLLAHERAHYAVDRMATVWEELFKSPSYVRAPRTTIMMAFSHEPNKREPGQPTVAEYEERYAVARSLLAIEGTARKYRLGRAVQQLRDHAARLPAHYAAGAQLQSLSEADVPLLYFYHGLQGLPPDRRLASGLLSFDTLGFFPGTDAHPAPVTLLLDAQPLGLATGPVIRPYPQVDRIEEEARFLKQLDRIDRRYRRLWDKTKRILRETTAHRGLNFEWIAAKGFFTVRLDRAVRVALAPPSLGVPWRAVAVGTHDEIYG
jgi:hypothetical protein